MYKIIDWILLNQKLAIIIFLSCITILVGGIYIYTQSLTSSTANTRDSILKGNSATYQITLWNKDLTVQESEGWNKLISGFQLKGYPAVTINTVSKKNNIEFANDFLRNPDDQPDLMLVEDYLTPFYQRYSTPVSYFKDNVLADYRENSVDVIKNNTIISSEVYGVPLSVDNMQMYVNKDLLANLSGVKSPASDWKTLLSQAASFDTQGGRYIATGLGSSKGDINNYQDIIGSMLLQKRVANESFQDRLSIPDDIGLEVIALYNSFKPYWNGNSKAIDLFKQGSLLYYFDYYKANSEIKAGNPTLNYEIFAMPQFPDGTKITHANFNSLLMHKKALNDKKKFSILQDFMFYLTTEEARKIYAETTKLPSVSRKIAEEQFTKSDGSDNNLRKFYAQALVAKAIIPYCPVYYVDGFGDILKELNLLGNGLKKEEYIRAYTDKSQLVKSSLDKQNTCFPFRLSDI